MTIGFHRERLLAPLKDPPNEFSIYVMISRWGGLRSVETSWSRCGVQSLTSVKAALCHLSLPWEYCFSKANDRSDGSGTILPFIGWSKPWVYIAMPFSCIFNLGKTRPYFMVFPSSTTNRMKARYLSSTQTRLKTTILSNRKRFRRAQKVSSVVRSEGEIHG